VTRLPTPGSDDGTWGNLLNDFLSQAHNPDGSLKQVTQDQIQNLTTDLAARAKTTDLKPVATSGSYTDLTNKPTIPATAADVGAVATTGLDTATASLVGNTSSTTSAALRAAYGQLRGVHRRRMSGPAVRGSLRTSGREYLDVPQDGMSSSGPNSHAYLRTAVSWTSMLNSGVIRASPV
jgi:hypothetical protein